LENNPEKKESIKLEGARSVILIIGLFVGIALAVSAIFYRAYISNNYQLFFWNDCDPAVESCFAYTCDPVWDDWCIPEDELTDPRENIWPYKIFEKNAANISPESKTCSPWDEECPELSCEPGEERCGETLCDPAVEGENACIGPGEDYFSEDSEEENIEESMEENIQELENIDA